MAIEPIPSGRRLYIGPASNAELLEVVSITSVDADELVIHAMQLRPEYRRLLEGH
jgi:hypothetical protein